MKLNTSPSGTPSLLRRNASSKLAFSLATIRARTPAALAGESRKIALAAIWRQRGFLISALVLFGWSNAMVASGISFHVALKATALTF